MITNDQVHRLSQKIKKLEQAEAALAGCKEQLATAQKDRDRLAGEVGKLRADLGAPPPPAAAATPAA